MTVADCDFVPPFIMVPVPSYSQDRYLNDELVSIIAQNVPVIVLLAYGASTGNSLDVIPSPLRCHCVFDPEPASNFAVET